MLQYILSICRSGGMADAPDSKSGDGDIVRVQVPPPAPNDPNLSGRGVRIFLIGIGTMVSPRAYCPLMVSESSDRMRN